MDHQVCPAVDSERKNTYNKHDAQLHNLQEVERSSGEKKKMSDLPVDSLTQSPHFTQGGLDVFGQWNVCAQRTRVGLSESKRWVIMFIRLATREIHMQNFSPTSKTKVVFETSMFHICPPHGWSVGKNGRDFLVIMNA